MDFQTLKRIQSESVTEVAEIISCMDFGDIKIYSAWLAQTYFFVRHTSRILCMTAAYAPFALENFHLRSLSHISEERGHEKLALKDLANLGFKIEDFNELPSIKAFYRSQYYFAQNVTPTSFLGYALFLEGLAALKGEQVMSSAAKNFPKALTFIKLHAEEDGDHVAKAMDQVNSLPENLYPIIAESIQDSAFFYGETLKNLEKSVRPKVHQQTSAGSYVSSDLTSV